MKKWLNHVTVLSGSRSLMLKSHLSDFVLRYMARPCGQVYLPRWLSTGFFQGLDIAVFQPRRNIDCHWLDRQDLWSVQPHNHSRWNRSEEHTSELQSHHDL